jgi:hypothetical protein
MVSYNNGKYPIAVIPGRSPNSNQMTQNGSIHQTLLPEWDRATQSFKGTNYITPFILAGHTHFSFITQIHHY